MSPAVAAQGLGYVTVAAWVGFSRRTSVWTKNVGVLCNEFPLSFNAMAINCRSSSNRKACHFLGSPVTSFDTLWCSHANPVMIRTFYTGGGNRIGASCSGFCSHSCIPSLPRVGFLTDGVRAFRSSSAPAAAGDASDAVQASESTSMVETLRQKQQALSKELPAAASGSRRMRATRRKQQQQAIHQIQQLGLSFHKESTLLNLENIFLSWMRNALLATSCSMIAYSLNDWYSSVSGMALLSIGGVCLLVGTIRLLVLLPRVASHCRFVHRLQCQWQQQQLMQRHETSCMSSGNGSQKFRDWTADVTVALQMFVVISTCFLWAVAATGVAGNFSPEMRNVISPFVCQRTLRSFEREPSNPQTQA